VIEYNDILLGDEPCEDGVSIYCFRDSPCHHLHHQELIRERQPSKFWVLAWLIPQEYLTVKQHIIIAEVSLAIYTECTVLWCVLKQATEGFNLPFPSSPLLTRQAIGWTQEEVCCKKEKSLFLTGINSDHPGHV
jgi:hypothetical protein